MKQALFKNEGIDEKTLRALIVAGSVKALCSFVNGPLFHVEVITSQQLVLATLTGKDNYLAYCACIREGIDTKIVLRKPCS